MTVDEKAALIEAILFLDSEPLDIKFFSRISGLKNEDIEKTLDTLRKKYERSDSGIELTQLGEGYMLSPKENYWEVLKERYGRKNDNKLSKAALETLSIIAYSQPITKAEIENIRGVGADGMMKVLSTRNLIKVVGKKDVPGKPLQYGTTREFLKYFKISSIANLPKLDEMSKEKFEIDGE